MENEKPEEQPKTGVQKWFEVMDRFNSEPLFPDHKQPVAPKRKIFD